jgi:hypothetical protein
MVSMKALYIGYLTGLAGQTIVLLYIGDGIIAGVDAGTLKYSGSYNSRADGTLEGDL